MDSQAWTRLTNDQEQELDCLEFDEPEVYSTNPNSVDTLGIGQLMLPHLSGIGGLKVG